MNKPILFIAFAMLGLSASAEQLYKWIDKNGVTHYGDSVPVEYTSTERHVLNEQGVIVRTMAREKTEAELAAEAAQALKQEKERQVVAKQKERDRILLDTYLSLDEISMLRDRRLMSIEAQVGVTRQYLGNLQERWEKLEAETRLYNFPYSDTSELPPLPEDLAQLIIHTERAMAEYLQTVQVLRREQDGIRADFAKDAERFVELKATTEQAQSQ